MNRNIKTSLLDLIKLKASVEHKMFAISPKVLSLSKSPLSIPMKKILSLSMGRIEGLRNRVVIVQGFYRLVLSLKKNHGVDFTIKWLKCCYVALQKAQAGDNLVSLRALEPGIPLRRLINGLPAFIKSSDRKLIKEGKPSIIRFWSSLFSVYRVLKCSYKLKVATITDPYTGCWESLSSISEFARKTDIFQPLEGFDQWKTKLQLSPRTFIMSSSASPISKISWQGLLSEIYALNSEGSGAVIRRNLERYSQVLKDSKFRSSHALLERIDEWSSLLPRINALQERYPECNLETTRKLSWEWTWGQLSLKEEAAGKLRVFAMVDAITQSFLAPLHDEMFSLLRLIPNDGTFDQTASIYRSSDKAAKAGCAFSFDLSAATDRLPASLTSSIITNITGVEGLGYAWMMLLTDREFAFSDKTFEKYGSDSIPRKLRYSVGQPMGALSSWAGLAITHHFILQYCSLQLPGRVGWNDQYEILGDDLVVFDSDLADEYLKVMKLLGVEINLTKSIVSPSKPVFEFAKRTFNCGQDVSPIPFKQMLGRTLPDRVSQFLALSTRGLFPNISVLRRVLSRFGNLAISQKEFANPILASLGALVSMKLVPHRWLVESLIEPKEEFDFNQAELKIPLISSFKLILELVPRLANVFQGKTELSVSASEVAALPYPWSKEEIRKEIYEDWEDEFANVTSNRALTLAKVLERDYDSIMESNALSLFANPHEFKQKAAEDIGLLGAIVGGFEDNLIDWNNNLDVGDAVDAIESDPKVYYRRGLTIEHATGILERVESLYYKLCLRGAPSKSTKVVDSAGVILNLNKVVKGVSQKYWTIDRNSD
nr:MAG: putative RNA dependent RNA polymerase [Henan mito-like virus 27]